MAQVQKHLSNGEWLDCGAQPGNCPIKGEDGETVEHMSAGSEAEMTQKIEADLEQRHGTFGTVSKSVEHTADNPEPVDTEAYINDVFSDYFIDEDDEYYMIQSNVGADSIMIGKDELGNGDYGGDDVSEAEYNRLRNEDIKNEVANIIQDFDADEELESYGDGGEGSYERLRESQEFKEELVGIKRKLHGLEPLPNKGEEPVFTPEITDLPDNDKPATVENIQAFMEAASLEGPNSEVNEQGDEIFFSMEAPNNATMGLTVPKGSTMHEVYSVAEEHMDDFSAEQDFDEFWSRSFAEHNGFTASQFADMLYEDEKYYQGMGDKLKRARRTE